MPWASRTLCVVPSVWGRLPPADSAFGYNSRLRLGGLTDRPTRRVEGRADLPEQLLAGVGLRDKPASPLPHIGPDLILLANSPAKHTFNSWVVRLQFF